MIDISHFDQIHADNFEANVTIRPSGSNVEVVFGDALLTLLGVIAENMTAEDFILA